MECGLLPLTQNAMYFAGLGYHDYEGPAVDLDEQKRLVKDLGDHEAMILRNHGLLSVGTTIPEAFVTMYWLERACQAQVFALLCQNQTADGENHQDHQRPLQARPAPQHRRAGVARACCAWSKDGTRDSAIEVARG